MVTEIPSPTIIAEGTRAEGSISFYSSAHIFGAVDGELHQESLEPIQIGRTGWVHGTISSRGPVIIEGRIDGDVHSSTKIRLLPSASVTGNLDAPSIEILAGALFDGELSMKESHRVKDAIPHAA